MLDFDDSRCSVQISQRRHNKVGEVHIVNINRSGRNETVYEKKPN